MVAAMLAYGRVDRILKSVGAALKPMIPSPSQYVRNASPSQLEDTYSGFVHRFATGRHLSDLLQGIRLVITEFGSLYGCFLHMFDDNDETVMDAASFMVEKIVEPDDLDPGHLLPLPRRGSACKRLNLFLRWMVRKDDVDPGGWKEIPPSKLIIPLDVHMHRTGLRFGFTKRRQTDMRTALDITEGFRRLNGHDPVRYDFALTRLGIRGDIDGPDWAT